MKKIYNAPEADLLCFRAVEDLAIDFSTLVNTSDYGNFGATDKIAAVSMAGDIKINAKK